MIFAAGIIGLHNSTPHGEAGKGKHYGDFKKVDGTKSVQEKNCKEEDANFTN
jgi:hypothetical protein